jgi:hypothetical protein
VLAAYFYSNRQDNTNDGKSTVNNTSSQLASICNNLNKNCPMILDKDTRLENVLADGDKTLIFQHSFFNQPYKNFVIDEKFKKLVQDEHTRILNAMLSIPFDDNLKFYKENRLTLIYRYSSKDGVFLYDVKITPEEYVSK